jgi:hypothetical protein
MMHSFGQKSLFYIRTLIGSLCLLLPVSQAYADGDAVYQIKASYIYNFLQYVTFPKDILEGSRINVCIVGENNFGSALNQIDGASTPQATIHVVYLGDSTSTSALSSCNAVYLTKSESSNTQSILSNVNTKNVLTIAEYSPFNSLGGLIELYIQDDKVRFRINRSLVRETHFQISSQLVQLATN